MAILGNIIEKGNLLAAEVGQRARRLCHSFDIVASFRHFVEFCVRIEQITQIFCLLLCNMVNRLQVDRLPKLFSMQISWLLNAGSPESG
jgi:hypothetical protein